MKPKALLTISLAVFLSFAFAQNDNASLVPYRIGDKWGYATDGDARIKIPAKYDQAEWFSEGLAAVQLGSKWGYINEQGKLVIPIKFTVAKPFVKGYTVGKVQNVDDTIVFADASIRADMEEICIDTKGNALKGCPARNEEGEGELVTMRKDKAYSLTNDGFYDEIEDDYTLDGENYYLAKKGGMFGVFDSKFNMVLPFTYKKISLEYAQDSLYLLATSDSASGLFSARGKEIFPVQSTELQLIDGPMNKVYVIVRENSKTYLKSLDGTLVIDRGYNNIFYDRMGGFVLVGNNNLQGFYFTDNTYIQPKYTEVRLMRGGKYLMVKTFAGDTGYIDAKGVEYFTN